MYLDKAITNQVAKMMVMLEILTEKLSLESARVLPTGIDSNEEVDSEFEFPLKSKNELDDFENKIRSEPTFKSKLVCIFYFYLRIYNF